MADAAGHIYVTGPSWGAAGSHEDYATAKYGPDGALLWAQRYDGPGHAQDIPTAIALGPAGGVVVTGSSGGAGSGDDFATLAYAPDGTLLWSQRYDGPGHARDRAFGLGTDAVGNIYVGGESTGSDGRLEYATLSYAPDGRLRWVQRASGPGSAAARGLAVDPAGMVVATGVSDNGHGGTDVLTVSYDAAGAKRWEQRYPAAEGASGNDVALGPNGEVYVVGSAGFAALVLADDRDGRERWVQTYAGASHKSDQFVRVAVDPRGNIVATGTSWDDAAQPDIVTAQYAPDGTLRWAQRYDGEGHADDFPRALAVDPDGAIYVAGASIGRAPQPSGLTSFRYDYATIKYDPSGTLVWAERWHGPRLYPNIAMALALDPAGNVIITGSGSNGQSDDMVTITYAPSSA